MTPAAGTLSQRIDIERRAPGTDAWGQPVQAWEWVASRWADVRLLAGLEAIKAGADVSTVQASYRLRYRAGLNAGMRLIDSSESWDIQAVLDKREDGAVDLVCRRLQ